VEALLSGNYRSVFKGPGIEFDEVREYFEGDDARMIDWNVSSRMGTPFTKTYKEERELSIFIVVDVSASVMSGSGIASKVDTANVLTALISFAAVRNSDRVGGLFFSDRIEKFIPLAKGNSHASRLIKDLIMLIPEGKGSDMSLALRTAYESLKRRGIVIIVSDFRTASGWREMTLLSRKHDVIAMRIDDESDYIYPFSGLVELEDNETGRTVFGYGRSKRFRREYREFWDLEKNTWEKSCRKRGVDILSVSTDEDPVKALVNFFNRRRGR
jgi:uncharacterized protein (DUF58 family)